MPSASLNTARVVCLLPWAQLSQSDNDRSGHNENEMSFAIPRPWYSIRTSEPAEVVDAEVVAVIDAELATPKAPKASWLFRAAGGIGVGFEWLFGAASLVFCLAVLAAIPVVQLLSLGYFLEVSGRIARGGKLRHSLIGIRKTARVGSLILGTWLWLWPIRYVSALWYSAYLIDPSSAVTQSLRTTQLIVATLVIAHILAAWCCGGRLRHFFWMLIAPFSLGMWSLRWLASRRRPRWVFDHTLGLVSPRLVNDICNWKPLSDWFLPAVLIKQLRQGKSYARARDALWDFAASLRLPYYFWLGARGFAGSIVWLLLPSILLIGALILPPIAAVVCGIFGAISLLIVVLYLPYLQVRLAAENRFPAIFEVGEVRRLFRRAPIVCFLGLAATLLFAVPLYFLKIQFPPRELTWLVCLGFVILIIPGRILTGWAIARARKRERPRWWVFRFASRIAMLAVAGFYVFVVCLTPITLWFGMWSLIDQHAFLLPAPFLWR